MAQAGVVLQYCCGYTYMQHFNALGTTLMNTDQTGAVRWQQLRYPWGQVWEQYGDWPTARFAGMDFPQLQGNDVTLHRVYNQTLGRWLVPDPGGRKVVNLANPQTWNMYDYVTDNPTSLNDPSGMAAKTPRTSNPPPLADLDGCFDGGQAATKVCALIGWTSYKATVIYGETAGLRPEVGKNGKVILVSVADLKKGRENIADISVRNSGVYAHKPSAKDLKNPIVRKVWQESQAAAAASNGKLPGYHFFIRQAGVGRQRPSKAQGWGQGKPIREYGPFINVGGGDVPKGPKTYIDIYYQ